MTQATQLAPEADDEALLAADTLPASLGFDEAGPENCCPKCQAPGLGDSVEWCLKCGFYPRMGFHVEVDPQEDDFATAGMSPWDPRRIPAWAWFLTFGLLAILAESIAIRFIFPVGTLARALWAIGQCVLGCLIFAVVHLRAYIDAISDDAQITVMDILLRPLKTWAPTIHKLPATSKRVCLGAWSFAAAVMGPAVIGGIPYHLIWEMGPEEQVAPNLVHAITDAARGVEGEEKPLDEAIQDFAGRAGDVEDKEPFDKFAPENLPQRKHKIDCLIVGYKPAGDDGFSALVLAAAIKNKLQVIGTVPNEYIPPDVRQEMLARMKSMRRDEPFVPTTIKAVWVDPVMTCRVGYNGIGASHRITDPVFQKQLGDVELKK